MTIICGHKWTQNQRKTLKITGKKCIFTNNRLKIIGFERFISIGYLSGILIGPMKKAVVDSVTRDQNIYSSCSLQQINIVFHQFSSVIGMTPYSLPLSFRPTFNTK